MSRWRWMRHAPVPDPGGRIIGRLDPAADVSDHDWISAAAARIPRNSLLLQSPALRVAQTVAALEMAGLTLPPPIIDDALWEQDFGAWEGVSWSALADAKDPDLPLFWNDPAAMAPPGGESFCDVAARAAAFIDRIEAAHPDRDILVVAHAGIIRAALAHALRIKARTALLFDIRPLSLTRIDIVSPEDAIVRDVNWLPE